MDWSNESYVRIYTRDTSDLLAVGWEGRSVLWELVRKADRAGVIDHGGDIEIIAEMLRMPPDIVARAIERLARREVILLRPTAIVIKNYGPAQEAMKSDKQRQRESRAARHARALAEGADAVTARAAARPDRYGPNGSRNVTPGSRLVTTCHERDQGPLARSDSADRSRERQRTDPIAHEPDKVTERDPTRSRNVTPGSRLVTTGHNGSLCAVQCYAVEAEPSARSLSAAPAAPAPAALTLSAEPAPAALTISGVLGGGNQALEKARKPTARARRTRSAEKGHAVEKEPSAHVRARERWAELYRARYGTGPTWVHEKHGPMLKRLLDLHGYEQVVARAERLMTSPPHWLRDGAEHGSFHFGTLVSNFDALAVPTDTPAQTKADRDQQEEYRRLLETGPIFDHGDSR